MSIKLSKTKCCALAQLSISNEVSINTIDAALNKLKIEADKEHPVGSPSGGERCVFCIVSHGEDALRKNLKELGFKEIYKFPRRNGYPNPEFLLEMWVYTFL